MALEFYSLSFYLEKIYSLSYPSCSQVVHVIHHDRPGISNRELKEELAKMYKIENPQLVVVFGMKNQFGGGRTTGFGLIYDNLDSLKKFEPIFRKIKVFVFFKFLHYYFAYFNLF